MLVLSKIEIHSLYKDLSLLNKYGLYYNHKLKTKTLMKYLKNWPENGAIYENKHMFIQYLIASQNDLRKCTYMYSTTLKTYPTVYNNHFVLF